MDEDKLREFVFLGLTGAEESIDSIKAVFDEALEGNRELRLEVTSELIRGICYLAASLGTLVGASGPTEALQEYAVRYAASVELEGMLHDIIEQWADERRN